MRPILPLLAAGVAGAAVFHLTAAGAQGELRPARDKSQAVRLYEGSSNRGVLQEAIDDASERALRALPGADRMVQYRVREIAGEAGGIRGGSSIRVIIEVAGEPERPVTPPAPTIRNDEREQEMLRKAVRAELRIPKEVERGEALALELVLTNTSEDSVRIPLNSGQKFDFEIWRDNKQVWKWSSGRFFTQALGTILLKPDEEVVYRTTWDQRNADGIRVPSGPYQVRGYVPTRWEDFRIGNTAGFTITGR